MRLYPLPCFREQLLCMFHFWLCNIPVAWCSHWESGEWGHILGWWGKVARHPDNSAFCLAKAVSKTQLWPLPCCLHPAFHLASWAPLRGICLSLKWNCWPFKKTRNRRVFLSFPSPCSEIWAGAAFLKACFVTFSPPPVIVHQWPTWNTLMRRSLPCACVHVDVIYWDAGVQLLTVSRGEIRGELSLRHVSDITLISVVFRHHLLFLQTDKQ